MGGVGWSGAGRGRWRGGAGSVERSGAERSGGGMGGLTSWTRRRGRTWRSWSSRSCRRRSRRSRGSTGRRLQPCALQAATIAARAVPRLQPCAFRPQARRSTGRRMSPMPPASATWAEAAIGAHASCWGAARHGRCSRARCAAQSRPWQPQEAGVDSALWRSLLSCAELCCAVPSCSRAVASPRKHVTTCWRHHRGCSL